MLTNSLRGNAAIRFERNIPRARTRQGAVLSAGAVAQGTERAAVEANQVGPRKVPLAAPHPLVAITPGHRFRRRMVRSPGITAETVQEIGSERTEYRFQAPVHLLVMFERGVRREGETIVEGLPRSALRNLSRKFAFVPAGHDYRDWREPSTPARTAFFYFDPTELPGAREADVGLLAPRLFFEDPQLFATAQKLVGLIEGPEHENSFYIEALGRVLTHEFMRLDHSIAPRRSTERGGLAGWQQRIVTGYIEDHLADRLSLAELAELVGLSSCHFCRAFKQSVGIPPRRYHACQRIDRAKTLLAKPDSSVTDIGLIIGFNNTSSFTTAFRKATGLTPTSYRRSFT